MNQRDYQKHLYRVYIKKLTPYINWHIVCKETNIDYENFRKFREGVNARLSLPKLRILFRFIIDMIDDKPDELEDITKFEIH